MRNFVLLVIVCALAYYAYNRYFDHDPKPVQAYKKVMSAWAHGDLHTIGGYCADPMTEHAFEIRTLAHLASPMEVGDIIDIKYKNVTAVQGESANEFTVKGDEEVLFNPAGIKAANYASWHGIFHETMQLKVVAEDWKVTGFDIEKTAVAEIQHENKL